MIKLLQIEHFTTINWTISSPEQYWAGSDMLLTGCYSWWGSSSSVGGCWWCLCWPGHWPSSSPALQLEPWCSVLCSQPSQPSDHTHQATSCNAGLSKINERDFTGFKWDILSSNEWVEQVTWSGLLVQLQSHTATHSVVVYSQLKPLCQKCNAYFIICFFPSLPPSSFNLSVPWRRWKHIPHRNHWDSSLLVLDMLASWSQHLTA